MLNDRPSQIKRHSCFLDVVGTAEAAFLLGVEKPRVGRWQRNGVVTVDGERVDFPAPIVIGASASSNTVTHDSGWARLAATPPWWADDIRALAPLVRRRANSCED